MHKFIIFAILLLASRLSAGDTLKILFVYGSKPLAEGEKKIFGGIHGGHVSLQYKDGFASFVHNGSLHFFPKKNKNSAFIIEKDHHFREDTSISRYIIVNIPIDSMQAKAMDSIITQRLQDPEYDYAFMGYRCASSAYEIMAKAGIFKRYSTSKTKRKYFYPKLLRKKILKDAKAKHWKIYSRAGTTRRKWEKD